MDVIIKAYKLTWESWRFTFKNLGIGIALILFPCVVTITAIQNFGLSQTHHPIIYFLVTDALLPFWVVGWLRYVISQKLPTVGSYFKFDKTFFLLLLYAFVVGIPLYAYEYINHLVGFNALENVIQLKQGVHPHIERTILQYYGVGLITLTLISAILLPFYFIFPSLVDRKPFPLLKSWSRVQPFFIQYGISYTILLFVVCAFGILTVKIGHWLDWYLDSLIGIYELDFIANWPIWSFFTNKDILAVIWQYFVSLSLFALVGLYYKRHLSTAKKAKAKSSKSADAAPAAAPASPPPSNPF